MRTLLRVGGIAGALAGALALALAPRAGVAVAALVTLAGLAAGLATAKWLPPTWYGRQLGAGLRAGLIACVIAVPATLIALLEMAPQGEASLAISPATLAPLASLVGGIMAADTLAVVAAALAALVLAACSARIFASDKSTRFVKAVARAREASQPLHEEGIFAPVLARRTAVPLAAAGGGGAARLDRPTGAQPASPRAGPQRRTLAPATPPDGIAGTGGTNGATVSRRTVGPAVRRTVAPALHALPREAEPPRPAPSPAAPPTPAPAAAAGPPAPAPAPAAPVLKRRSGGRPQAARLTPEMIEALAAWARDTEEDDEDGDQEDGEEVAAGRAGKAGEAAAKREPVESSYLNTPAPAPKRKRKKNATRDWIC